LESASEQISPSAANAQCLGLDARVMELALEVLAAAGLLYKRGERYDIPADAPAIR